MLVDILAYMVDISRHIDNAIEWGLPAISDLDDRTMMRSKSKTTLLGGLGFCLLLLGIYSSRSNNSLRGNDETSYFPFRDGTTGGSAVEPTIDLYQLVPTTKRVAGRSRSRSGLV